LPLKPNRELREDMQAQVDHSAENTGEPALTRSSTPGMNFPSNCVFTFWKGRIALFAILKALGVGRGDTVIVPGYTCFAVPSAIAFTGARPIYADIDPSTFNLSLESIQAVLADQVGARIKAILIQHTYGIPANSASIVAWATKCGFATIEDCAHVWGSRYRDQRGDWRDAGSLADAAFFSSQWTKPAVTGIGGWARTENLDLQLRLRRFREIECVAPAIWDVSILAGQVALRGMISTPRLSSVAKAVYQKLYSAGLIVGTSSPEELHGRMPVSYAKRMSRFQEWLLGRRLAHISVLAHRRRLKSVYDEALKAAGLPAIQVPGYSDPVLLRYPVRVARKKTVLADARKRGIEMGDWYSRPVDSPDSFDLEAVGYRAGMCPEGERAGREVVNLPMGDEITVETALRIVRCLKECL